MTRSLHAALILTALLGSLSAAGAQSRAGATQRGVPKLDLTATCRAMDGKDFSIKIDTERCLKTEDEARAKLAADWATYRVADRNLCTQTARLGGIESYVQLLTCLELQQGVVAARAQGSRIDSDAPLMRQRPAGLPRQ
jgi:hypothetical protein